MKVLVVGGGTAGLVAATLLKRKLDFQVDIVRSKDIGIVGVGEGSTEHFQEYLQTIGLDPYNFIKSTNSTLKYGIIFDGWNPSRPYMHSLSKDFADQSGQYNFVYGRQIANNSYMVAANNWDSLINRWFLNRREEWPANQFHFNTHMLGDYLTHVAQELGCRVFDDEIEDVILKENGHIEKLKGKQRDYRYDFYIDSTGFKRILMSKFDVKWKSFSEYMRVNSAFTFQTDHPNPDNFPMWTLAKAMNSGWLFQLSTYDHMGNGYIFDKECIDQEEAKKEVEELFGHEVSIGKTFSFDPGYLETAWVNNCVAIGLASAFVEPLEATSIGTSIQQAFMLCNRIANYDEESIRLYNDSFKDIMENIRDFISLHYVTPRRDTEFWRKVSETPLPDRMQTRLETWKNRLPISEDFNKESDYIMFSDQNFIQVMEGLELFDRKSIKKEYAAQAKLVKERADEIIQEHEYLLRTMAVIRHKDYIRLTRDLFI